MLEEIIESATSAGVPRPQQLVAVALYLATYFEFNKSGLFYYQMNRSDEGLVGFIKQLRSTVDDFELNDEKIDAGTPRPKTDRRFQNKIRSNYMFFQQTCVEAESGNGKKMRKLQAIKKLFCVPWLLAGDTLLAAYPDKYA